MAGVVDLLGLGDAVGVLALDAQVVGRCEHPLHRVALSCGPLGCLGVQEAGRIHEVDTDREVRISYPWTSPELLDGRSNGSVASDVYSLGATIWNLLVGRSPFAQPQGDNSSRGLAVRILHAPPPLTQRSDVPPALDRLLQQCLAKDPAHRPAGALELARGLQQIESQLGFARTPIAVELPGAAPSFTQPKPDDDGDATIIKPISILPDGELRSPAAPPLANARTSPGGATWQGDPDLVDRRRRRLSSPSSS